MKSQTFLLTAVALTALCGCKENFNGQLSLAHGPITLQRADGSAVSIGSGTDAVLTLTDKQKNDIYREALWIDHQEFDFLIPGTVLDPSMTHISASASATGQGIALDAVIGRKVVTGSQTIEQTRFCRTVGTCWMIYEIDMTNSQGQTVANYDWKYGDSASCAGSQLVQVLRTSYEDDVHVDFKDATGATLASFVGIDNAANSDQDVNTGRCDLDDHYTSFNFKPSYQPTSLNDYR